MREFVDEKEKEDLFNHIDCWLNQFEEYNGWSHPLYKITTTLLWKCFIDGLKHCQTHHDFPRINFYQKYKLFAEFLLEIIRNKKSE